MCVFVFCGSFHWSLPHMLPIRKPQTLTLGQGITSNKQYYRLMPSTWIHVFLLCLSLSLSAPEFHANHRRISLQAPRSHQLPSATFCHTLSEGRCLKTLFFLKIFLDLIKRTWKIFRQPRSRCVHSCLWFFAFFSASLSPSLSLISIPDLLLSSSLLCNFTGPVSHIIYFFLFAQSFCFSLLQVKRRLVITALRLMFIPDLFILSCFPCSISTFTWLFVSITSLTCSLRPIWSSIPL